MNKSTENKPLPGWTLIASIAAPGIAIMVVVTCRDFGLSWATGIPAAVVVVVAGLLLETLIERKYRPSRRRK
jgi:hypothetical protein